MSQASDTHSPARVIPDRWQFSSASSYCALAMSHLFRLLAFRPRRESLRAALKRLQEKHEAKRKKNPALGEDRTLERLAGLTHFFAVGNGASRHSSGARDSKIAHVAGPELAPEWPREHATDTVIFSPCPPVMQVEGVSAVRVYVLAPPHDADALVLKSRARKATRYISPPTNPPPSRSPPARCRQKRWRIRTRSS
jgi:hypothetical protein